MKCVNAKNFLNQMEVRCLPNLALPYGFLGSSAQMSAEVTGHFEDRDPLLPSLVA